MTVTPTPSQDPDDPAFLTPAELGATTDNPGLHPALIDGAHALSEGYRDRLVAFIARLVDRRGFPQHLACVFNALRYGYDTDAGGYHWPLLSSALFADLWVAETSEAVPVGAFVNVLTRREVGEIPAEVVYKEGRHPAVTAEYVPDDLPGKAAEGDGGAVAVREALVVDRFAFVDLPDPDALDRAVDRIRGVGDELDPRGHYVGDLAYRSIDDAELADMDFFAHWLARRQGAHLLAELLDTDDVGTSRTAVQQILRTLRAVVDAADGLELWRGYVYSKARYDARTDDETADSVYGAEALTRLWRSISAPPVNGAGLGAPDRVALHPLTLRLLDLYVCTPQTPCGQMDPVVAAHVDETAWVTTIVHAQVFLSREADVDSTDDGLVATTLERTGAAVHTRVDDPWQHGAVWRTERLAWPLPDPPPTLLTQPIDRPLGLGAAPWVDDEPVDAVPAPADEAADDAGRRPSDAEDFLAATFHTWVVRLAPTRLDAGVLPVPGAECGSWRAGQAMTVRLNHDGKRTVHSVTFDAGRRLLLGLDWPISMPVAAKIRCQIATGGTLITAYTFPLDAPLVITEGEATVRVHVEVDEALLRRWLAGAPATGAGAHTRRTSRPGIAEALVGLLAVRGEVTADGERRLDLDTLTRLVFGVEPTQRLRSLVLRAAHQAGFRIVGADEILWSPGAGAGAGVDIDLAALAAAGDPRAAQARQAVRPHVVRMHLRRLTVSEFATPQRRREYPEARAAAGRYDLPEHLPAGYTFVTEHEAGG